MTTSETALVPDISPVAEPPELPLSSNLGFETGTCNICRQPIMQDPYDNSGWFHSRHNVSMSTDHLAALLPEKPMDTLVAEALPVTTTRLLSLPVEKLTVVEQTQAYVIIGKLSKVLEARNKELRIPLLALAEAQGEITGDKGTRKYLVEGSTVYVEHRKANEPNPNKLKELMAARKIDLSEAFEEVTVLQLNPSKLQFLIDTGKLTEVEVKALCADVPALKITPSRALKEALAGLKLSDASEESPALPPKS